VGEHLTSGLQDLLDDAVALEGREGQNLGDDEEDETDKSGGFHGKGFDVAVGCRIGASES